MPGNDVIVIVEVLNQFLDCFAEFKEPLLVQNASLPILMRERQAGDCNLAIILAKRICLQILLGIVNGLIRVSSEHALIEALRWRESRRIGQKNVEKFEALGMAARTTKQTVSGTAMTRPIGPHSHVQNDALTMTAKGEMPVVCP